jgi:hypothetical protein
MTDTPQEAAIGNQAAIDLLAHEKSLQRKKGRVPLLGERKKTINTCITPRHYDHARLHRINLAAVLAEFIERHITETEAGELAEFIAKNPNFDAS